MTVQERLTDGGRNFTPSEIKVVRQLLANYPVSGLTTISGLAKRSHVSDPTVVRLAYKLGFDGFADMQEQLLAEVEAHLNSPLTILAGKRKKGAHTDLLRHFLDDMAVAVRSAADEIVRPHFEQAADLLADRRKRVLCLGGRFSRHLAAILRWHLQQLRSAVEMLNEPEVELADRLADVGPRDVLVVYDLRRYQENVVFFAGEAHARGCKTILFTDKWQSPIAANADIVFPIPVESASPFDTMVPALALTEVLIATVTGRLADRVDGRLEEIERLRTASRMASSGSPLQKGQAAIPTDSATTARKRTRRKPKTA
jgi:DNA-binding MurR/RpiR family transcriptional regulator